MFDLCLQKGKQKEKEFVIKMIQKQLDILKIEFAPNQVFKDRDVKLTYNKNGKQIESTFEIKSDDKSIETGNICFEYCCNGKPSGVYNSKADFIVYQIGGDYYIKPRAELLVNLNYVEKKDVKGGDGDRTKMFIVSKDKLHLLFNKI